MILAICFLFFLYTAMVVHTLGLGELGKQTANEKRIISGYNSISPSNLTGKKISGGLRSISVTVVGISFIQEAYMAFNRILPPTKLAGHHPRTRLK